jgi:glycine oxidase
LILATGFFRHGVLLAPAAASITVDLMDGRHDERWTRFRPDRFPNSHHRAPATIKDHA